MTMMAIITTTTMVMIAAAVMTNGKHMIEIVPSKSPTPD